MKFYNALVLAIGAGLLSGCGGKVHAAQAAPETDWPSYNGNVLSERYSELTQISVANAGSLHRVCSAKLGDAGAFESSPVVTGGTLYVTLALKTYAIDPVTCAIKWTNTYAPKDKIPLPTNRGVAVAGNRVVRGEPDGHLIAIDASSGKTLWDVAPTSGAKGEFLSAAPIVWDDMVFIGTAGSDWGVKGRMMAFDVNSGKRLWTFSTISADSKSWGSVRAAERGGGGTWTSYSLDPATGELFVPVANPAPDFAGGARPGANLYTDSIVVLDAKTGALKWYHQMVPHDVHDWDQSAAPVLYTAKDGTSMFASAGKDGYIDGIDRSTHESLFHTAGVPHINDSAAPTTAGVRTCPGVLGGSEWNGPAFDRRDDLLITPMNHWCAIETLGVVRYIPGAVYLGGFYQHAPQNTARGTLTAIDDRTGKVAWQYSAPAPMIAGVTPTAGGVTFTGDGAGNFLVFDSSNGKVLYKDHTTGSIAGGVVTYTANGKQYVALNSGNISRIVWGVQGTPTLMIYSN